MCDEDSVRLNFRHVIARRFVKHDDFALLVSNPVIHVP